MSAAENKRSVMVGIFVLLGIIIFIIGIFTLAGQQKRFINSISLHTTFTDVAGLKPGNNVWFSGVKIGTVKAINFSGESQVEITLNIQTDVQQYVRRDAKVRISSESLIGNRILEIFGGTPQAPQVQEGDRLQSEPMLNTDDILVTLQENNKNLVAITTDFKELSSKLVNGEGAVGAMLTDTTLANNFRNMVASLQQTSANTVRASRSLNQFTAKLNTQGGLVDQLATDTAVFRQLQASVAQLQQATTSATAITNNLQQASGQLNNSSNAAGVLLNDPEFANRLKATMENLETSTEKFDQNMEALQHNFLLRGFFRRQAKQEAKQQQ
ncbi:MCE family protein [Pontibacter qinzhouensis]|uniref:MCE family protein n=1 Tax=Pontibacter qinzhouensis TaxID=2603253 RepID=A0A5C8J6S3_9BACT|nr:MlaD family protein [Pontibacter qinzhouensis]TXK33222.1 MCE family protein [Pontibacter qinzhouensis]